MSKIIFWLVVIFVVLFVLRLVNVAKARRAGGASQQPKKDQQPADAMVRCSECGIFLPKAEAIASSRGYRCSEPGCAQRHGNAR